MGWGWVSAGCVSFFELVGYDRFVYFRGGKWFCRGEGIFIRLYN